MRGSPVLIRLTSSGGRCADPVVEVVPRPGGHLARADRPQRLGTRLEPTPGLALALAHGRHPRPQLLTDDALAVRRELGEHREQDVRRVQHGAAVEARVQVARPGADLDRCLHEAARADGDRRCALVRHQRVEDDRAVDAEVRVAQPAQHRAAADLLLSLDQEAHVHGQLARARELAGHMQKRQEVALVVRRAARVEPAAALGRLERRRGPGLARARVLDVVVAIGEHGRRIRARGAQVPDRHRVASVDHDLVRLAARGLDPLADPVAGAAECRGVAAPGGDRGNAKPVDELIQECGHGRAFSRNRSGAGRAGALAHYRCVASA